MGTEDFRPLGTVAKTLPGTSTDTTQTPIRLGRYGEQYVSQLGNVRHNLSAEGSYIYFQNATIDAATTLAGHAAPVLADLFTKPFLFIRNDAGASSTKLVHLDFIRITVITAGASGTSDNWAAECDTGATRNTSAGTALTQVNPNMQSQAVSGCSIVGGAPVASAATTLQRRMGHGVFRPSIGITGDKYTFVFGADAVTEANVVASAITHHIIQLPPVALGPTDQFLLHLYAPSQSAAAVYKVSGGMWVR